MKRKPMYNPKLLAGMRTRASYVRARAAWHVLSALRGPDRSEDFHLKMRYTARIRGWARPGADPGVGALFGRGFKNLRSLRAAQRRLCRDKGSGHTMSHLRSALWGIGVLEGWRRD